MQKEIQTSVEEMLIQANIKANVSVTPKFIAIEDIVTEKEAATLENLFTGRQMKSLGITDMTEIEMGTGFSLTILI